MQSGCVPAFQAPGCRLFTLCFEAVHHMMGRRGSRHRERCVQGELSAFKEPRRVLPARALWDTLKFSQSGM